MAGSPLPPVLLELRSNVSEFLSANKEAQESLSAVGAEGEASAARLDAAVAQETAAQARLVAAMDMSGTDIKATIDEQVAAEARLAEEMGVDFDAEARQAQLTAAAIKQASSEQIAAQRAVVTAQDEVKAAQSDVAASAELNAEKSASAWSKGMATVKSAAAIAGVAVAGESLKMAVDFQQQTTRLVTAAGESQKSLSMVQAGIKSIAMSTGTSLDDLNSGAYQIESAGFHGAAAISVLKAAAQGAKVEMADMKSVGNALTTVMDDMGDKSNKAALDMSQMVAAVGQGKMTMDDLAGSIHSVLPNAAQLGMTFPQVAGDLAEMTAQGMSADQAAQNLNHTIVKLASPTQQMTKIMAMYGLQSSDVAQRLGKVGLSGTLDELYQAIMKHMGPAGLTLTNAFNQSKSAGQDMQIMLGQMTGQLKSMSEAFANGSMSYTDYTKGTKGLFGGRQAAMAMQFASLAKQAQGFNAVLQSGQPAAQTFTAAMKGMLGDQTALQVSLHLTGSNAAGVVARTKAIASASADAHGNVRDWATIQKELSTQLAQARQMIDVVAVDIGQKLIPVVSKVIGFFIRHKTAAEALAMVIGGVMVTSIAAYVAKLTWGAVETVGRLATIVAGWAGVGPAATAAAVETEVAGEGMEASFGPVGLAIGAVAIAGTLLATHWKQAWGVMKEAASGAWNDAIKPVFTFIREYWGYLLAPLTGGLSILAQHWSAVWGGVKDVYDTVIQPVFDFIGSHWQDLLAPLTLGLSEVAAHWSAVWGGVKEVYNSTIGPVFDWVKSNWRTVLAVITGGLSYLIMNWRNVWNGVSRAVSAVWDGAIRPVATAIRTYAIDPLVTAVQVLGQIWDDIWDGVASVVEEVWDVIQPIIKSIHSAVSGISNVIGDVKGVAGSVGGVIGKVAGIFDQGGPIPGAPGEPMAAIVHGGEYMLSTAMLNGSQAVDRRVVGAVIANATKNFPAASRGSVGLTAYSASQRQAPAPSSGGMTVNVQGSVIDTNGLFRALQTVALQNGTRNAVTWQPFARS